MDSFDGVLAVVPSACPDIFKAATGSILLYR